MLAKIEITLRDLVASNRSNTVVGGMSRAALVAFKKKKEKMNFIYIFTAAFVDPICCTQAIQICNALPETYSFDNVSVFLLKIYYQIYR